MLGKQHTVLQSKFTAFNFKFSFVYAGGLPRRTRDILQGYQPLPNLRGCLQYVSFDRRKLLPNPKKTNYRVYGSPQQNCSHMVFPTLSFEYPSSYLLIALTGKDLFNVEMLFRTYIADRILALKTGSDGRVIVSLHNVKVFLEVCDNRS